MAADYIPVGDAGAASWFHVFAAGLVAKAELYRVTPEVAAAAWEAAEAFALALEVCKAEATRTKGTCLVKDQSRVRVTKLCRPLAMRVKADDAIPDSDKIAIGVRPLNRSRSPVNLPHEPPVLMPLGLESQRHYLKCVEPHAGKGHALARGAVGVQVFVRIGDFLASQSPDDSAYLTTSTRAKFDVRHTHADAGKYATYYARWISRKGQVSRFSGPLRMMIAA